MTLSDEERLGMLAPIQRGDNMPSFEIQMKRVNFRNMTVYGACGIGKEG